MNLQEFTDFHYAALALDETRHNVLLAILKRGQRDPSIDVRTWTLGAPGACAVQQSGFDIVLGDVSKAEVQRLASQVRDDDDVPSIMGSDQTARWFVDAASKIGQSFPCLLQQTIHVLYTRPIHHETRGSARPAQIADVDLVHSWLQAFVHEAVPDQTVPTLEDTAQRIKNERVMLWTLDGQSVAMSCVGRQLDNGIAIAPVYTPPEHRCHGFAGAVTAAVVDLALDRGFKCVYLFTDDSNEASNRCYAKIGFRPYCKCEVYRRRSNN